MSIYLWWSRNALEKGGVQYQVIKYQDTIRKQTALVKHDEGKGTYAVAYFRDDDEAVAFADTLFGGIVHARHP